MKQVLVLVERSQLLLRARLEQLVSSGEGLTEEHYVKYLSMQYHLTQGVQRHFMIAASHPDMAGRRELRDFLVSFASEEELHYQIARADLQSLGYEPLPLMLDVKLWRAYFDALIFERPFVRLGATCVLENISSKSGKVLDQLLSAARYATPKTTRFLTLHRHELLPHGDQIIDALTSARLTDEHLSDLALGAFEGTTLFLRLIDWCLGKGQVQGTEDFKNSPMRTVA